MNYNKTLMFLLGTEIYIIRLVLDNYWTTIRLLLKHYYNFNRIYLDYYKTIRLLQ